MIATIIIWAVSLFGIFWSGFLFGRMKNNREIKLVKKRNDRLQQENMEQFFKLTDAKTEKQWTIIRLEAKNRALETAISDWEMKYQADIIHNIRIPKDEGSIT